MLQSIEKINEYLAWLDRRKHQGSLIMLEKDVAELTGHMAKLGGLDQQVHLALAHATRIIQTNPHCYGYVADAIMAADILLKICDLGHGECSKCGTLCCPHDDPLHFHHDGCPSCN